MKQAIRPDGPDNPIYGRLRETVDQALEQLEPGQPVPDENIHTARKSLKKARAVLRLLRDGMSDDVYQAENSGLRDAGRVLSPIRDARSLIDAFDSLHDRYTKELEKVELEPLRKILQSNLTKARRRLNLDLPAKSAELKNCIRGLEDCLVLTKREDFAAIDPAVERSRTSARLSDWPQGVCRSKGSRGPLKHFTNTGSRSNISSTPLMGLMPRRMIGIQERIQKS